MSEVIWCISKYALPPKYGAQHRLFKLSEKFNKKGYSSIVISSSTNHLADLPQQKQLFKKENIGSTPAIFIKGIRFESSISRRRVLSWFIFEWRFFWFILSAYKKYTSKPDVILVSSLSLLTILNGIIAKWLFGAKLIFEVRDIWPMSAVLVAGYSEKHPFVRMLRWVEKLGYQKADVITSPLENLKEHIENSISQPFSFVYIPHGYDPDPNAAEPLDEAFIQKYIPRSKFKIAYIGNIVSAYDLETMLACAKSLDKKNTDIHFLVLGNGNHKEQLMSDAANLSNITFIPRIPKAQVPSFLAECDLMTNYLLPKPLFKYGVSPQKLIDYMLAGKPIVMSYTGYPSSVSKVGNGVEIEAGNVERLVKAFETYSRMSKAELQAIGEKGRQYLTKHLYWAAVADKYIEVIKKNSN